MTELEEKGLEFYLRHVGVVASDEDFEAWYMQRHLGGRVCPKLCHLWLFGGRHGPSPVRGGMRPPAVLNQSRGEIRRKMR